MPLSRKFSPSYDRDGNWFKHIGCDAAPTDYNCTTYSRLYSAPWDKEASSQPEVFNLRFGEVSPIRHKPGFKSRNPFTAQENKHFLASCCEGGLGNSVKSEASLKSQMTDPNLLSYVGHGESLQRLGDARFQSTSGGSYLPFIMRRPDKETGTASKQDVSVFDDQPRFRRFRKQYDTPAAVARRPSTQTTDNFVPPDVPYKTPLSVVCATQEPRYTTDPWKYSYVGPTQQFAHTKGARMHASVSSSSS